MLRFAVLLLLCGIATAQNENAQQNGDLNSNTQNSMVNSNNETTNNSKTYNGAGSSSEMPVYSAVAPSLMSSGNDTCLRSQSTGLQFVLFGASAGRYVQDAKCNRRKDSKTLKELGMSIAAVSLMCQEDQVWTAMFMSGTPCPILINGRLVVGRAAMLAMRRSPEILIPNYKKNQFFYDFVLNIGGDDEVEEELVGGSISERYRTSLQPDGD